MSDIDDAETDANSYEGPDVETSMPDDGADDHDATAEHGNVAPPGGDEQTAAQLTADNAVEEDMIETLRDDAPTS